MNVVRLFMYVHSMSVCLYYTKKREDGMSEKSEHGNLFFMPPSYEKYCID